MTSMVKRVCKMNLDYAMLKLQVIFSRHFNLLPLGRAVDWASLFVMNRQDVRKPRPVQTKKDSKWIRKSQQLISNMKKPSLNEET